LLDKLLNLPGDVNHLFAFRGGEVELFHNPTIMYFHINSGVLEGITHSMIQFCSLEKLASYFNRWTYNTSMDSLQLYL
jgi:hypothetical protein